MGIYGNKENKETWMIRKIRIERVVEVGGIGGGRIR